MGLVGPLDLVKGELSLVSTPTEMPTALTETATARPMRPLAIRDMDTGASAADAMPVDALATAPAAC